MFQFVNELSTQIEVLDRTFVQKYFQFSSGFLKCLFFVSFSINFYSITRSPVALIAQGQHGSPSVECNTTQERQ